MSRYYNRQLPVIEAYKACIPGMLKSRVMSGLLGGNPIGHFGFTGGSPSATFVYGGATTYLYRSTDGFVTGANTTLFTAQAFDVDKNSTYAVVVGAGGRISTINSTGTVTARTSGVAFDLLGVTAKTATCYAVGLFGTVRVSYDSGATWTSAGSIPTSSDLIGIASNAGVFVGLSISNEVIRTDGGLWTKINLGSVGVPKRIAFINGKFIVVTSTSICTSDDGVIWSIIPLPKSGIAATVFQIFSFAEACFISCESYLLASYDFRTWEVIPMPPSENLMYLFNLTTPSYDVFGFDSVVKNAPVYALTNFVELLR